MRIRMQGFIVMDYIPRFPEARKELSTWLAEGKIKRKETILKGGLEAAEKGLIDLYNGVNTGKFDPAPCLKNREAIEELLGTMRC